MEADEGDEMEGGARWGSSSGRTSKGVGRRMSSRRSVLGLAVEGTRKSIPTSIADMGSMLEAEVAAVERSEEMHPTLRLAARVEALRVLVHDATPVSWPPPSLQRRRDGHGADGKPRRPAPRTWGGHAVTPGDGAARSLCIGAERSVVQGALEEMDVALRLASITCAGRAQQEEEAPSEAPPKASGLQRRGCGRCFVHSRARRHRQPFRTVRPRRLRVRCDRRCCVPVPSPPQPAVTRRRIHWTAGGSTHDFVFPAAAYRVQTAARLAEEEAGPPKWTTLRRTGDRRWDRRGVARGIAASVGGAPRVVVGTSGAHMQDGPSVCASSVHIDDRAAPRAASAHRAKRSGRRSDARPPARSPPTCPRGRRGGCFEELEPPDDTDGNRNGRGNNETGSLARIPSEIPTRSGRRSGRGCCCSCRVGGGPSPDGAVASDCASARNPAALK